MVVRVVDQPALIRHGGYGATRRTTIRCCPGCDWTLEEEAKEINPNDNQGV